MDDLSKLKPDLIVSFSATQRFRDDLISLPVYGCVNVHYGDLPRYGGLSPYFWYLLNEEKQFGVTLHRIVSKLDAGPILSQVKPRIEAINSCLELQYAMVREVSPMLIGLFSGDLSLDDVREQDLSMRSYFRHPAKCDVRRFYKKGYSMMNASGRKKFLDQL